MCVVDNLHILTASSPLLSRCWTVSLNIYLLTDIVYFSFFLDVCIERANEPDAIK